MAGLGGSVDDPFYKATIPFKAALDAHPDVEIRLF